MSGELELVSDGDGLAVIGNEADIDRFFTDMGLADAPKTSLDRQRLVKALNTGSVGAHAAFHHVAESGQWVKLTKESAAIVKQFGLMDSKIPGVKHAMVGKPGDIKKWLQIAQAPGALLSGPMVFTTLATMMSQQAMQRQLDEIAEYLEVINEKVDDILRGQKDAVLANMIGVDLVIEEALTVREHVGRVSDITWSKVQNNATVIASAQAYAIRQLDAIADKLEAKTALGDIARATAAANPRVREWLAVLARCFQLQTGIDVLELDRVYDESPEEHESHRQGLKIARQNRIASIAQITVRLLNQMDDTVRRANSKVLFNPFDAPAAVRSSNAVARDVIEFRERLEIESGDMPDDARGWRQAVSDLGTKIAGDVDVAVRSGERAAKRVASALERVDTDGDGVPDTPKAAIAAKEIHGAMRDSADNVRTALRGAFSLDKESVGESSPSSEEENPWSTDAVDTLRGQ